MAAEASFLRTGGWSGDQMKVYSVDVQCVCVCVSTRYDRVSKYMLIFSDEGFEDEHMVWI